LKLLLNSKEKDINSLTLTLTPSLKKKLKLKPDMPKFSDQLSTQSLEKETPIEDVLPLSKNTLNLLKKETLLCNNGLKKTDHLLKACPREISSLLNNLIYSNKPDPLTSSLKELMEVTLF
jgi:hypothetical protein